MYYSAVCWVRWDVTNEEVLQNLLIAHSAEPLKVPTSTLLDWINTIPSQAMYRRARTAFLKRDPKARNFYREFPHTAGSDAEHTTWLKAAFQPPVYSTDAETGERLQLRHEFLEQHGFLSNTPQKCYSMPDGLDAEGVHEWLTSEPDEKDVIYMDHDGNEYDLMDGQFIPKRSVDVIDR